jgi:hypothetical protein
MGVRHPSSAQSDHLTSQPRTPTRAQPSRRAQSPTSGRRDQHDRLSPTTAKRNANFGDPELVSGSGAMRALRHERDRQLAPLPHEPLVAEALAGSRSRARRKHSRGRADFRAGSSRRRARSDPRDSARQTRHRVACSRGQALGRRRSSGPSSGACSTAVMQLIFGGWT